VVINECTTIVSGEIAVNEGVLYDVSGHENSIKPAQTLQFSITVV
jgi:hypothetical protein